MWECPREQSRRRANTTALLPASHPAQTMQKRKLPLLPADAVRLQTQAQVLPGLEILMLYAEALRQMLLQVTRERRISSCLQWWAPCDVIEGSDSLPFQFTKNLWHCSVMTEATSGKSGIVLSSSFLFLQGEKGSTHLFLISHVQQGGDATQDF